MKDDSRALTLGALTLPLARLLTASELTLDQWFQLSSSGPNSRLYMKLVMRVWRPDMLRVVRGLVDSLVLGIKKGNPLRSNELVYVEAPSRHTQSLLTRWGKIWYMSRKSGRNPLEMSPAKAGACFPHQSLCSTPNPHIRCLLVARCTSLIGQSLPFPDLVLGFIRSTLSHCAWSSWCLGPGQREPPDRQQCGCPASTFSHYS